MLSTYSDEERARLRRCLNKLVLEPPPPPFFFLRQARRPGKSELATGLCHVEMNSDGCHCLNKRVNVWAAFRIQYTAGQSHRDPSSQFLSFDDGPRCRCAISDFCAGTFFLALAAALTLLKITVAPIVLSAFHLLRTADALYKPARQL